MTQPSASPALSEADRDAALLEEIGFAFARYLSARDMDAVTYGRVRAAVEPIAEEAIALRSDLAAALIQISDLAQAKGEAEGRLRASEMVGVVEGWRDRALKAEAERDVFEVKLDGSEARVQILHQHLDWWRTKGKAAEANLIALAKMYGEACGRMHYLGLLMAENVVIEIVEDDEQGRELLAGIEAVAVARDAAEARATAAEDSLREREAEIGRLKRELAKGGDRVYAPDGRTWQAFAYAEAAKRGPLQDEIEMLRGALQGILPDKLCGESGGLPDTGRMPIQTTLGALKAARAALSDPQPSPAKGDDHHG